MFPGSLTLGKWRIRGNETGRFVLERFDDDGEVQTDGWLPVAAFTHDPDMNAAGLESTAVRADTLSPLSTAADASVTCDGHMTVTGRLACGGVVVANGSVVVPSNLTVGGVSFASLNFNAIEPLRMVINLTTGATELRLNADELNPFFCAGRVNANATVASSIGQVGYTVSRPSGFGAGVYQITFASPAPNNNYVISLAQQATGFIKIWDSTDAPGRLPTTEGFHVVCSNPSLVSHNIVFHFSVRT
jgi:hypothetical protein